MKIEILVVSDLLNYFRRYFRVFSVNEKTKTNKILINNALNHDDHY
jgi:hypothetical protein